MINLGVNIDHIATLRQARGTDYPDVVRAAKLICEKTQAYGITTHLREDRRHIQDDDIFNIKKAISKPLNMEMAVTEEMVRIACELKPFSCCLVPEKRAELTTEGGLDAAGNIDKIKDATAKLKEKGIKVSLFIEPDTKQIEAAKKINADYIEIHTGKYANLSGAAQQKELELIKKAANLAESLGLTVNAGHGLNYENTAPLLSLPVFKEFNIGHSIIAESFFAGLEEAVNKMLRILGYNV